jgi:hypothetical protein
MNYQQLCTNMSLDIDLTIEALASDSWLIQYLVLQPGKIIFG